MQGCSLNNVWSILLSWWNNIVQASTVNSIVSTTLFTLDERTMVVATWWNKRQQGWWNMLDECCQNNVVQHCSFIRRQQYCSNKREQHGWKNKLFLVVRTTVNNIVINSIDFRMESVRLAKRLIKFQFLLTDSLPTISGLPAGIARRGQF